MAIVTGTTSSFTSIGQREDLTDVIYDISPTETPFMSSIPRVTASATFHEWQTDALASATNNAQLEGDDVAFTTAVPTTRVGNHTQISRKEVVVSGTLRAVDQAGRDDELAYQIAKQGRELKRDMEVGLVQNGADTAGTATAARTLAGVESWLSTNNTHLGVGAGTTPGVSGGRVQVAPTDGTQLAFTKASLDDVIQQVWVSGGNPGTIMTGPFNKTAVSDFSGVTAVNSNVDTNDPNAAVIIAGVDLYRSDFGTLRVVPNRFSRDRTALVLDFEFWAVAFVRGIEREPLAKTGDADKEMLITEYTLEARNEASSGKIADLTVS